MIMVNLISMSPIKPHLIEPTNPMLKATTSSVADATTLGAPRTNIIPGTPIKPPTAIVAARHKIVEGAVSMVEMALEELNKKQIVELDEERKAAMVSNLMVILCGDKEASPVLNTGTLNH